MAGKCFGAATYRQDHLDLDVVVSPEGRRRPRSHYRCQAETALGLPLAQSVSLARSVWRDGTRRIADARACMSVYWRWSQRVDATL